MDFRSVFISDMHIGNRWCRAGELDYFLSSLSCENLYLLGDVFEGWSRKNTAPWNLHRHPLIRKVIRMARVSKVQYITGNHDAFLDDYSGSSFEGIEILRESTHTALDGRKMMLVHGDEYDIINRYRKHLARIGHTAYQAAMNINAGIEALIPRRKKQNLAIANFFKDKIKDLVQRISDFDNSIKTAVATRGMDGIICGHIHRPEIRVIGDTSYYNCGDWINHCSALVEHFDGTFELIDWRHEPKALMAPIQ